MILDTLTQKKEEVIGRYSPTKRKRLLVGTVPEKKVVKRLFVGTVPKKREEVIDRNSPTKKTSEEVICRNSPTKKGRGYW